MLKSRLETLSLLLSETGISDLAGRASANLEPFRSARSPRSTRSARSSANLEGRASAKRVLPSPVLLMNLPANLGA